MRDVVPFDVRGMAGYAQRVFECYRANPALSRLQLREALERDKSSRERPPAAAALRDHVARARAAQGAQAGAALPPEAMLTTPRGAGGD